MRTLKQALAQARPRRKPQTKCIDYRVHKYYLSPLRLDVGSLESKPLAYKLHPSFTSGKLDRFPRFHNECDVWVPPAYLHNLRPLLQELSKI